MKQKIDAEHDEGKTNERDKTQKPQNILQMPLWSLPIGKALLKVIARNTFLWVFVVIPALSFQH